jgi:hypothetical protein
MNSKGLIIGGLALFIVAVTFPVWHTPVAGGPGVRPELERPADATRCVEDKAYMTSNHMDLLNRWRDAAVRDGEKTYTSKAYGTEHEMSLTRTCMTCHASRETFCARCHAYADVHPYCWDCHVEKGK